MTFASAIERANASVLKHLANVRVRIGGAECDGIFKMPSLPANVGIGAADSLPSVTVATSAVPSNPVESEIDVDGVPYVVTASDPDGAGLTVLALERTQ
jgi:hypothetical protein